MDAAEASSSFFKRFPFPNIRKNSSFHSFPELNYRPFPSKSQALALRSPKLATFSPFPCCNSRAFFKSRAIKSNNLGTVRSSLARRTECEGKPEVGSLPEAAASLNLGLKAFSGCNSRAFFHSTIKSGSFVPFRGSLVIKLECEGEAGVASSAEAAGRLNLGFLEASLRKGFVIAVMVCAIAVVGCRKSLAVEGALSLGMGGALEKSGVALKSSWPKVLQVLMVFKEQGLVLAALLGLSAFFSMAETSITTLWPWKVRELAEKESENGVFKMLRSDVTRFLTTILIGTTVVNIGATALVTEAATAIFGEAGVSAATGVMTVAILLLTEITPKSIAVHNATDVARFVVRPVAWLSLILYPVGRVVTYLSMGMLKLLGLKGRSEPYVTEDELKLMLRGAELSGSIEEEEQDMIENVLEIKDTHVREVMTPLVDVVAIDASSSLVDFHDLRVTHQYSRVPVFEQRIDNVVGIAYAMDLLDYVQKGELLESSVVGDMAHKPAYFVPDSMSVWNLLREFRIRKVHMAVVLNEYGGTIGIVTLEDVVEEIVGEIFDESDSSEEIQKKTGYIVMRAEGVYDVDANTSIDHLSEDLNIKMPEGHQYETVSGFVCEAFGYIPRTGERIKVVLQRENEEERVECNNEAESDGTDQSEKNQIFKLEILAGNARKVSAVRFERINNDEAALETKGLTRLVPKFMKKKKWGGGRDDSDETNKEEADNDDELEVPRDDRAAGDHQLSDDDYVISQVVDSHNHEIKQ